MHDWTAAAKPITVGVALSPRETVRKVEAFCQHESGYWLSRLKHRLQPGRWRTGRPRPFRECDPRKGLDPKRKGKPRYRSSLARKADAGLNRRSDKAQTIPRSNADTF